MSYNTNMGINNLSPADIMQWYSEKRISPGECANMLENILLQRKENNNLFDRVVRLHQGYKDSLISVREYCMKLYHLAN